MFIPRFGALIWLEEPVSLLILISQQAEKLMTKPNSRTGSARLHDDRKIIDKALNTPAQGRRSGGALQRDIAAEAEEEQFINGQTGVTRVRKEEERD